MLTCTPTQPNALEAPHQLQLDSRARLHMTGVIEVESFDESTIVLTTTRGTLIVRGEGLHLQLLRLDGGRGCWSTERSTRLPMRTASRQAAFWRGCSADGAAGLLSAEQARSRHCWGFCLPALYDLLRALRRVLPGAAGFADGLFALVFFLSMLAFALYPGQACSALASFWRSRWARQRIF